MQNADRSAAGRTRRVKGVVAVQMNSHDILAPVTPYSNRGAGSRTAVAVGGSTECCIPRATAPDEIVNIQFVETSIMYGTIRIDVTEPYDGGSPILRYNYVLTSGATRVTSVSTSNIIIVSNLPGGIYNLELSATNAFGTGPIHIFSGLAVIRF
jgi:hypothetical protein